MTLALTSYNAIQSNLFIKIEVDYYKSTPSSTPITKELLFSDRLAPYTFASEVYLGLGNFISISSTTSELRPSTKELTISLSGIPNSSISEIVNSRIKGSLVTIYRGLFDANTGSFLDSVVGNPIIRFKGYVNNISLDEDYDVETRQSSNTITLVCNNIVDVFENKISGRRTNPSSQKKFYPNDISMDRVPNLENTVFDFGAK